MFGRKIMPVPVGPHSVTVTHNVTERRAPTDDSVRLLREMEKSAREQVLETVRVGDTHFEAVAHRLADFASADRVWRVVFSLNGKRLTAEYRHPVRDEPNATAEVCGIRDAVARKIADEALQAIWAAFGRRGV